MTGQRLVQAGVEAGFAAQEASSPREGDPYRAGGGHRVVYVGAFHRTGQTGPAADVILRRPGPARAIGDAPRDLAGGPQ
jgi:hypothetical protein